MIQPTEFEKRFATQVVSQGWIPKDRIVQLYREREAGASDSGRPAFDEYLVTIGALSLDQAAEVRQVIGEDDPLIGQLLGGYEIVEKVGAGGMGALYRGHDPALDKSFAVKVINPAAARNPNYLRRLQAEARLASRIDDPHTVPIIKLGQERGIHYCVMPFIEGRDIARHVRATGPLDLDEALDILEQAARGLAAIHRLGIIHRDVKPDNLLLSEEGVVKVADFGLARDLASDSSLTATGQLLGTPHYMSPEQATGEAIDHRTDIYSLGLTFYYLLSGQPPFDGNSALAVIDKQRRAPLPDPAEANPAARGEPIKLLRRMTAKDPELRPASMEEILADLETLRARGRIRGPGIRFAPPGRRSVLVAGGLAAALLVLGSAVAIGVALGDRDPDDDPDPEEVVDDETPPGDDFDELLAEADRFRDERFAPDSSHHDLERVLDRYRAILDRAPGTPAAERARTAIADLELRRREHLARRKAELHARLLARAEEGSPLEALRELDRERAAAEAAQDPAWSALLEEESRDLVDALSDRTRRRMALHRAELDDADLEGLAEAEAWFRTLLGDLPPGTDEADPLRGEIEADLARIGQLRHDKIDHQIELHGDFMATYSPRTLIELRRRLPGIIALADDTQRAALEALDRRVDELLPTARATRIALLFRSMALDDRQVGLGLLEEVLSEELARLAARPLVAVYERLDASRRTMWQALWRDRPEEARAPWDALVAEKPESEFFRKLDRSPIYPYPAEMVPIEIHRTAAARIGDHFEERVGNDPKTLRFRPSRPPGERRDFAVRRAGGGGYEFRTFDTTKWSPFDPLADLHPEDRVLLFLEQSIEDEAAPPLESVLGRLTDPQLLSVAVLFLLERDTAAATALAARISDEDIRDRLDYWIRLVGELVGERGPRDPLPGAIDPADIARLEKWFGQRYRVLGVSARTYSLEIELPFDDPRELDALDLPFGARSRTSVASGRLSLRPGGGDRNSARLLDLRGQWQGDLHVEADLRFDGEAPRNVEITFHGPRAGGPLAVLLGTESDGLLLAFQKRGGLSGRNSKRIGGDPPIGLPIRLVLDVTDQRYRIAVESLEPRRHALAGSLEIAPFANLDVGVIGIGSLRTPISLDRLLIRGQLVRTSLDR